MVLVLVLGLIVVVTNLVAANRPRLYETRVDGYACTPDVRQLQVFAGVGPGDHVVETSVQEDRDKVTIVVRAADPEPREAFQNLTRTFVTVNVRLSQPLANRTVVDRDGNIIRGQCP